MSTNVIKNIGGRLREERERIGISQHLLAAKVGISRMSQVNYESGKRSPDANYLGAIYEAGIDVEFLITGKRKGMPDFYKLASLFIMEKIEARFGIATDVLSFSIDLIAEAAADSWLKESDVQHSESGCAFDPGQFVTALPLADLFSALSENDELLRNIFGTLNTVLLDNPMHIPAKKRMDLIVMLYKSLKGADTENFYDFVLEVAKISAD